MTKLCLFSLLFVTSSLFSQSECKKYILTTEYDKLKTEIDYIIQKLDYNGDNQSKAVLDSLLKGRFSGNSLIVTIKNINNKLVSRLHVKGSEEVFPNQYTEEIKKGLIILYDKTYIDGYLLLDLNIKKANLQPYNYVYSIKETLCDF